MQSVKTIRESLAEGRYDSLLSRLYCRPADQL